MHTCARAHVYNSTCTQIITKFEVAKCICANQPLLHYSATRSFLFWICMLFFHLITTTRQRWRAGFAFFYWFQQDPEFVGAVRLLERYEVPICLAMLLVKMAHFLSSAAQACPGGEFVARLIRVVRLPGCFALTGCVCLAWLPLAASTDCHKVISLKFSFRIFTSAIQR